MAKARPPVTPLQRRVAAVRTMSKLKKSGKTRLSAGEVQKLSAGLSTRKIAQDNREAYASILARQAEIEERLARRRQPEV